MVNMWHIYVVPYMNDLCIEKLDLHKTTVPENSCEHSIFYIWMMSQNMIGGTNWWNWNGMAQFRSTENVNSNFNSGLLKNFNSNSNSTHFGSIPIQFQFRIKLTPALQCTRLILCLKIYTTRSGSLSLNPSMISCITEMVGSFGRALGVCCSSEWQDA